ncbi:MAG: lipocalin family protein [Aequorivita sp.]
MKNIKFLLVALIMIGTLSCSSDNDEPETLDIIGTWSITEGFIEPGSIVIDMGGMDIPVEYSGSFVNLDEDNRLYFNDDNTFSSYTGDISLEMEMVVMGTPQTETIELSDVFGDGTWEVNGRELKVHNDNGSTVKYHIDNLDGNYLELSGNVKDMDTGSGSNPILDSLDIIVKMKLKRV